MKKNNSKKKSPLLLLLLILAAAGAGWFLFNRPSAPSVVTLDGYQLKVNGKPHLIRGACYSPVPIGKDYEYNFWGDSDKPWITDAKLMKEMGANTIRFYKPGKNPDEVRKVLDDLHGKFGIHVLMGTYLGFWNWPPPNYADEEFKDKIRAETLEMVRLYKDSPGILMWVLGNENNYSFDRDVQRWSTDEIDKMQDPEERRRAKARLYYAFVNELALEIKKIDSSHPVVMGVGEVASLDIAAEKAPDIDVIGLIAYRGPTFGNLFRQVKQKFDKPVAVIEYGADSFNALTREPDERNQAEFLKLQWQDIERNAAGGKGEGNCIGGTFFEWNDEWWKANENLPHTWSVHEEAAQWGNSSYYYDADVKDRQNINEEWFGAVALDPHQTENGIDKRLPKRAYSVLKDLWTKK